MKSILLPRSTSTIISSQTLISHPSLLRFPLQSRRPSTFSPLSSPSYPISLYTSQSSQSPASISISGEGAFAGIPVADFVEKDWSFLEEDSVNSEEELQSKLKTIISAGEIGETSRVMICLSSEDFVDRFVENSPPSKLLVVHNSLLVLALLKEKHDNVRCWQGDIVDVPEKWSPFDTIFISYLPALPFSLDQVFGALVQRCSPGARVVISFAQGRDTVEKHRQQYPDMVTADLPAKITLEKCKWNWSVPGQTHTKKRNRLEHKRLNDSFTSNATFFEAKCKWNWSVSGQTHTKKRNRLEQKRLNDSFTSNATFFEAKAMVGKASYVFQPNLPRQ